MLELISMINVNDIEGLKNNGVESASHDIVNSKQTISS